MKWIACMPNLWQIDRNVFLRSLTTGVICVQPSCTHMLTPTQKKYKVDEHRCDLCKSITPTLISPDTRQLQVQIREGEGRGSTRTWALECVHPHMLTTELMSLNLVQWNYSRKIGKCTWNVYICACP